MDFLLRKKKKKQNGRRLTQKALRVPLSLIFCREGKGHFRSSDEQIWNSISNKHRITVWSYGPISTPNN